MGAFLLVVVIFLSHPVWAELPADYQQWNAVKKQTYLWEQKIVPSKWHPLPEIGGGGWNSIIKSVKSMASLNISFTRTCDELPLGRPKFIHPSGSVVKIIFVPRKQSPYSGIYKGGLGLARLSLAGNPKQIGSYTPGMALKFLIDGYPSVNLHVMNSLDGQGDNQNFFENIFSNSIPEPKSLVLKGLKVWFRLFVKNPLLLGVHHLARKTTDGSDEKEIIAPDQLYFVPIQTEFIPKDSSRDFRNALSEIPSRTHLYMVEAQSDRGLIQIGDIYTTSIFLASVYGDHQLFFQHQE